MQQTQQLHLVAVESRPYNEFTDQHGNQKPAGVARRLWFSEGFTSPPFEATCSPDVHQLAGTLSAGAKVLVTVEFSARDSKLQAKVLDFKTVPAEEPVSSNGRRS